MDWAAGAQREGQREREKEKERKQRLEREEASGQRRHTLRKYLACPGESVAASGKGQKGDLEGRKLL